MSTERFEKIENAIRDLTAVSRTLVDSGLETQAGMKQMQTAINALIQAQMETERQVSSMAESLKHTDGRLNVLIETVNKLIRLQSPNGHDE